MLRVFVPEDQPGQGLSYQGVRLALAAPTTDCHAVLHLQAAVARFIRGAALLGLVRATIRKQRA